MPLPRPSCDLLLIDRPRARRVYRRARARWWLADHGRRLVCAVRGHKRIRVVDRARLVEPFAYRIVQSHHECERCHRPMPDPDRPRSRRR